MLRFFCGSRPILNAGRFARSCLHNPAMRINPPNARLGKFQ
jgi:hypothetical protein